MAPPYGLNHDGYGVFTTTKSEVQRGASFAYGIGYGVNIYERTTVSNEQSTAGHRHYRTMTPSKATRYPTKIGVKRQSAAMGRKWVILK